MTPTEPEAQRARAAAGRLLPPRRPAPDPAFDSTLPFFYRDPRREYFVVPTVYYQDGNYFTINAPAVRLPPDFKAEYRVRAVLPPVRAGCSSAS